MLTNFSTNFGQKIIQLSNKIPSKDRIFNFSFLLSDDENCAPVPSSRSYALGKMKVEKLSSRSTEHCLKDKSLMVCILKLLI